jgi:hypothetical protein
MLCVCRFPVTYPLPKSEFFVQFFDNESPRSLHQRNANPKQRVFHSPIQLSTPNRSLPLMTISGFGVLSFLMSRVPMPSILRSPTSSLLALAPPGYGLVHTTVLTRPQPYLLIGVLTLVMSQQFGSPIPESRYAPLLP